MASIQQHAFMRRFVFYHINFQAVHLSGLHITRTETLHWKRWTSQIKISRTFSCHFCGNQPSLRTTSPVRNANILTNTAMLVNFNSVGQYVRVKRTVTKSTETLDSSSGKRDTCTSKLRVRLDENSNEHSTMKQMSSETFDNYQMAYGNKSTFELLRVLSFFFFCRFSFVTDNAVKIMEFCYKSLGQKLAELIIRKSVYDQFVAGETAQEVKKVAVRLRQGGVASILCVPMETDDRVGNRKSSMEDFFDVNANKVVSSIELSTQLGDTFPMTQFRISALMSGDLTKTISRFCAQTTHNSEVLSALTEAMSGRRVDFSQLPGWAAFPQNKNEEFIQGLQRLGKIKDALENRDVVALVDAEYTSINPALRLLALCLMRACNKECTKVFYTYQAYLKTTRMNLLQDLTFASANGFGFGVKLVRGAYLVTERQTARELGYEDPVNETFDLTSASYHSCLDLLLEHVAMKHPQSVRFMVASHNEDTIRYAMAKMDATGIPKDGSSVFFGQLYGMADHVSFTLGRNGYRVYKSIPYGPVLETIPYLARRAQENKAILINARRERKLVAKALIDRINFKLRKPAAGRIVK